MLVLVGDRLLDLFVLGKYKRVTHVAMGVQLSKDLVRFLSLSVVNKPSETRQFLLQSLGAGSLTSVIPEKRGLKLPGTELGQFGWQAALSIERC